MKQCDRCKAELIDGSRYCHVCGATAVPTAGDPDVTGMQAAATVPPPPAPAVPLPRQAPPYLQGAGPASAIPLSARPVIPTVRAVAPPINRPTPLPTAAVAAAVVVIVGFVAGALIVRDRNRAASADDNVMLNLPPMKVAESVPGSESDGTMPYVPLPQTTTTGGIPAPGPGSAAGIMSHTPGGGAYTAFTRRVFVPARQPARAPNAAPEAASGNTGSANDLDIHRQYQFIKSAIERDVKRYREAFAAHDDDGAQAALDSILFRANLAVTTIRSKATRALPENTPEYNRMIDEFNEIYRQYRKLKNQL